jgi:hypothetical protein
MCVDGGVVYTDAGVAYDELGSLGRDGRLMVLLRVGLLALSGDGVPAAVEIVGDSRFALCFSAKRALRLPGTLSRPLRLTADS